VPRATTKVELLDYRRLRAKPLCRRVSAFARLARCGPGATREQRPEEVHPLSGWRAAPRTEPGSDSETARWLGAAVGRGTTCRTSWRRPRPHGGGCASRKRRGWERVWRTLLSTLDAGSWSAPSPGWA